MLTTILSFIIIVMPVVIVLSLVGARFLQLVINMAKSEDKVTLFDCTIAVNWLISFVLGLIGLIVWLVKSPSPIN